MSSTVETVKVRCLPVLAERIFLDLPVVGGAGFSA